MPRRNEADEKANYRKLLDEIGSDSQLEDENVSTLQMMYVGNRNRRRTAKPVGELLVDPLVDNPPSVAADPDYPDLGYQSDKEEEKFFVDQTSDGSDDPKLQAMIDRQRSMNYPAGNEATARVNDKKRKAIATQRAHQMKIANAKNLSTLICNKGLIAREEIPATTKKLFAMDNNAFSLMKDLVQRFADKEVRREKTASTGTGSLDTPIHLSKPLPTGRSMVAKLNEIQWSGVPPADYDHSKHISL